MSGHKKDEDEQKQHPNPDDDHIGKKEHDTKPWHEDYLDPQSIDVVDGQLTSQPKDHEAPRQ